MKTLLLATASLIAAAQISSAHVVSKLYGGTWKGNVDVITGTDIVTQRTTLKYKHGTNGSFILITTIKSGGFTLVGKSVYHKDGKVDGDLRRGNVVVAVMSGKWSATKTNLKSKVTVSGMFPTFKTTSSTELVFGEVLETFGHNSTGEVTSGIFRRK